MNSALYCEPCDVAWPYMTNTYKTCPGCGANTTAVPGMIPLGVAEAEGVATDLTLSRQRHEEFARFCEERDKPKIDVEVARFRQVLDALPGVPV